MAGLVVTAACGGGDGGDEAGVSRPDPVGPATSASPVATEPAGSSGVGAPVQEEPAAGAALADPVYVDGVPQVTASPTRAAAGTRVRLDGYGFTGDPWQSGGGSLWLSDVHQEGECIVLAEAEHDLVVTGDGHLSGTFVVPARGGCRFSTGEVDTGPARYHIAYQCIACQIGTFTVVLAGESMEEPTGTPCDMTVIFGVQNFASGIYADGLSCAEAESFLRDHARPLQPPGGAAHLDAGGFSCDRTGRSETALPPRANYRCTDASRTIHFIRQ